MASWRSEFSRRERQLWGTTGWNVEQAFTNRVWPKDVKRNLTLLLFRSTGRDGRWSSLANIFASNDGFTKTGKKLTILWLIWSNVLEGNASTENARLARLTHKLQSQRKILKCTAFRPHILLVYMDLNDEYYNNNIEYL